MPVHALHTIMVGTGSKLFLVYARDPITGDGVTGLRHDAPGASAAYVREGEGAVEVGLLPGTPGVWAAGGFAEIDPGRVPGVYQFGAPDALLATGSTHALLFLRFDAAAIDPVEIELVAYDPIDESCIGMAQLQDRKRHEFLRATLPGLTETELEVGRDAERELGRKVAERGPGQRTG